MKADDCIKIEPYEQEGVAGPLWKIQIDYQGLKLCGVGGNRQSLLRNVDRKVEEMLSELRGFIASLSEEAVK